MVISNVVLLHLLAVLTLLAVLLQQLKAKENFTKSFLCVFSDGSNKLPATFKLS